MQRLDKMSVVVAGFSTYVMESIARQLSRRGISARSVPLVTIGDHLRSDDSLSLVEADAGDEPTIAACQAAHDARPGMRILLLSRKPGPSTPDVAARVDAAGWGTFEWDIDDLVEALHRVQGGERVAGPLLADDSPPPHGGTPASLDAAGLSERETEVLRGLLAGAASRTLAEVLGISHNTVRTHVRNLARKLDVRTRYEAAAWARRAGLTPLDIASHAGDEEGPF